MRLLNASEALVEQAFADGAILRTHVMRPTWHFVTAEDIRWLLELTAPRVQPIYARNYDELGLGKPLLVRCADVMARALEGGKQLAREELSAALAQAGIQAEGRRFTYIAAYAELQAVICSGARRGKQFTYALFAERTPQARPLARDDALALLVKRYFAARGPATIPDFVWWSGLTSADAKRGLEMVNADLEQTLIDGQPHWMSPESFTTKDEATVYLLSGFDEFLLSYTDRSASLNAQSESAWHRGGGMFRPVIVIDGQVAGTWERTLRKKNVLIEYTPLRPFSAAEQEAFKAAAQRYADFLGLALSPIINPAN